MNSLTRFPHSPTSTKNPPECEEKHFSRLKFSVSILRWYRSQVISELLRKNIWKSSENLQNFSSLPANIRDEGELSRVVCLLFCALLKP
jgi:hypothetical protein